MGLASPGGRVRPGSRSRRFAVLLATTIALSACHLDTFTFGAGDDTSDAGPIDDGGVDDGGGGGDARPPADAMPDACVAFVETCNEADDDCDGMVDEDFNLDADPANCGSCGARCQEPNTAGTCSAGQCSYACLPGYVDTDNNVDNGCEYLCTPSNGGVERCDLADNDCDTLIDEDLNLDSDVNNCGTCGNRCLALNADPVCDNSVCTFGQCDGSGNCTVGECDPGFADLIPGIAGCEYTCPVFPTTAEECNGVDDDCDGVVDELPIVGLGGACTDPGFEAIGDTGACSYGTLVCNFGVPTCQGYVRPAPEVCNEGLVTPADAADDNCDGQIDEPFDKQNDPRYCGGCTPCALDHAVAGCSLGACTVVACRPGFVDQNGDPSDGCEYACTPSGPEVCDGIDNDCDLLVDLADPDLSVPANFCDADGACGGTTPTCGADLCTGAVGWQCVYGAGVEVDACGDILAQETRCDDIDGNCNGPVDEAFPSKGGACADTGIGVCRGTGNYVCDPADTSALVCDITSPGLAPSAEVCDNDDDDCDGTIDEDAPDDMVAVDGGTFYIYTYEASRPDATDTLFGSAGHRACSTADRMPWRNVSQVEAAAACAAAGKRLCTEAEWQLACAGPTGLLYPYGDTYQPTACNGRDVDLDCVAPDEDRVAATGTAYGCPAPGSSACVSPVGAFDLSGNLKEWTSTPVGSAFRVKGGAFDNIPQGLTCSFSFTAFGGDTALPNLGFRCCSDTPN
ncbi:MAG: SUMF1/EgtB/PvdO family nonheme iron enzyme [Kofleriaceae bacterium]|nr:SUMF1/EgtB/PvdO family nonheme iron enzyme [Myxococcales bacterium]MCB9559724.1 SUMF1/EgtB/PvdO family nonheme iron enzyme [Kofleriaceae bacterium]MCB9573984.1 SUMF1/EgtB/PvdO family nonheme iron enzyme [Kofleriaceae bacterium]